MFRAIICLILVSTVVCFYKSTFLGKKISRNMLKMDISDARVGRALVATTVAAALSLGLGQASALADEIKVVPQYTQKRSDLQAYTDINRGFQMKRPFGFNEFEGAGGGYLVKFASLFDVDENVVVGSAPASAGKTSITDYGDIKELGEKREEESTRMETKFDKKFDEIKEETEGLRNDLEQSQAQQS